MKKKPPILLKAFVVIFDPERRKGGLGRDWEEKEINDNRSQNK